MDEKPIKLYLAILNEGWLRCEHINTVLLCSNVPGVKLVLEQLGLTWDKPIASNRNRIVQRFLRSDCDFLMMIDDDVIPLHNAAEMVFWDKDVVGSPARRRKEDRLEWVAYCETPDKKGFYSIDLDRTDPNADLIKVDAIGTGCILIKRRVLETIKAPFVDIFDDDGVRTRGMDLNFCMKAKEAGFEIFVAPQRVSEHFREMGLVSLDAQYISHAKEEPQEKYGVVWGGITKLDWDFIKSVIKKEKIKSALEFGTGLSTLLMSELVSIDSFTKSESLSRETEQKLPEGRKVSFNVWDGTKLELDSKNYDLALLNGYSERPKEGFGKELAIQAAVKHSDNIIVHHAGMLHEMALQQKYLKDNGYSLISRNGWHQKKCHFWKKNKNKEN